MLLAIQNTDVANRGWLSESILRVYSQNWLNANISMLKYSQHNVLLALKTRSRAEAENNSYFGGIIIEYDKHWPDGDCATFPSLGIIKVLTVSLVGIINVFQNFMEINLIVEIFHWKLMLWHERKSQWITSQQEVSRSHTIHPIGLTFPSTEWRCSSQLS